MLIKPDIRDWEGSDLFGVNHITLQKVTTQAYSSEVICLKACLSKLNDSLAGIRISLDQRLNFVFTCLRILVVYIV